MTAGPDRDVDPEDGPPAEMLGQQPPEERADHEPEVDGCDVEAERTPPLILRDHRGQDGDGRPEDHGAPGSLDHPDRDHRGRGRDQGLRQGCEGEDGEPEEEDLLPTVDVGEPTEGDDEERRGQEVRGRDPGEHDRIHVELGPDRGERDVHGRTVEGREEAGEERDAEDDPLLGQCRG